MTLLRVKKKLLERCLKSRTSHRWREMHNGPYITQRGIISPFSLSFFSMNALVFSIYFRGSCDRTAASIGCVPRNTRPLWNTVSFSFSPLCLCFRSLVRFFILTCFLDLQYSLVHAVWVLQQCLAGLDHLWTREKGTGNEHLCGHCNTRMTAHL